VAPGGSTTKALAYRTGYRSRSMTQCRREPLSSRQMDAWKEIGAHSA